MLKIILNLLRCFTFLIDGEGFFIFTLLCRYFYNIVDPTWHCTSTG